MKFLKVIKDLALRKDDAEEQLLLGYARESEIEALLKLLGMLAKADGQVSESQIKEVQRFIDLQVPNSMHSYAKECFRQGKESNLVKGTIIKNAWTLYWSRNEAWLTPLQVLDILIRVALADGEYSAQEEYLVNSARESLQVHSRIYWCLRDRLAASLGVEVFREGDSFAEAEDLDLFKSRQRANSVSKDKGTAKVEVVSSLALKTEEAYNVLGLKAEATQTEIRVAYRALVKKCHPDILRGSGSSEVETQNAVAKFCEIQAAYEFLMD